MKIKLIKILILFFMFANTSFSQSNYETTNVPLEIQKQKDKLKIIRIFIEEMQGKMNIYEAKTRTTVYGGKSGIRKSIILKLFIEKEKIKISEKEMEYNKNLDSLNDMIKKYYKEKPIWLHSYTKTQSIINNNVITKKPPDELPIKIEKAMNKMIEICKECTDISRQVSEYNDIQRRARFTNEKAKRREYEIKMFKAEKEEEKAKDKCNRAKHFFKSTLISEYKKVPEWIKDIIYYDSNSCYISRTSKENLKLYKMTYDELGKEYDKIEKENAKHTIVVGPEQLKMWEEFNKKQNPNTTEIKEFIEKLEKSGKENK